jgi:hypothetical protein
MTNILSMPMVPQNIIKFEEMGQPEKLNRGAGSQPEDEHTNVSLYMQKTLHASIKKRAAALGLSVSKYLAELHKRDKGGEFVIQPEGQRRRK